MKIIPDIDSIIIEYQIDDKEKLRDVLKEKVVGRSKQWHYNLWTNKLKKNPKIYHDNWVFRYALIRTSLDKKINSPAILIFLNDTLFDKTSVLRIKVRPSVFFIIFKTFYLSIFSLALFVVLFLTIKSLIAKQYIIFFIIFFTVLPFIIGLSAVMLHEKYAFYRSKIISTFEKLLLDNDIKLTKIKETRQKPWFIRKLTKNPEGM